MSYPENTKEEVKNINRVLTAVKLNEDAPIMGFASISGGERMYDLFILFKNKYQLAAVRNHIDATTAVLIDLEAELQKQYPGGHWRLGLTSYFNFYPRVCEESGHAHYEEGKPFVDLRNHTYVDSDGWDL